MIESRIKKLEAQLKAKRKNIIEQRSEWKRQKWTV